MPSEVHESICRTLRQRLARKGFREGKNPLRKYSYDIYAKKLSARGEIIEQVVVEAEIATTLFKDHTIEQLQSMGEFLSHEKRRGVKTRGILAIPGGGSTITQAKQLLRSIRSISAQIELQVVEV